MSYHSKFTAIEKKISRLPRQQIYALVISSLAAISILDYLLPKDFPLSSFYLVPISIAAWVIGKRAAILVSLLATVPELLGVTTETYILEHPLMAIWHSVLFLSVMLTVTYLLEALRKELTARQSALQQSEADGQLALFISQHDSLTGLPNRSTFHAKLKASIQDAEECNKSFHVLFIDIDRFKQINDSLGHYAGDLLLKGMAKSLQSCIDPAEDLLARLSGDEFGIIFHSQPQGEKLALALMAASAQATMIEGQDVSAKISIGITTCPQDGTDAARLLICADLAMYHAKQMGGAAFRVYTKEMEAFAKRRQAIREGLRTALATNTLELHYQPIFFSDTDYIYGVEALLRWNCKHIPLLTTSELIAVAEDTGMISEVGTWVMRTACAQAKAWQDQYDLHMPVAVNISPLHFREEGFVPLVQKTLAEANLSPSYLELEITERVVMENSSHNKKSLNSLKNIGIQISVDDFGTGFSSLSYLKDFSIDALKIDQFFVKGLPHDQDDAAITNAIIGLAHGLGIDIIAEGVENKQQLDFLVSSGCERYQGFYLSEPLGPEDLTRKLISGSWKLGMKPQFQANINGFSGQTPSPI